MNPRRQNSPHSGTRTIRVTALLPALVALFLLACAPLSQARTLQQGAHGASVQTLTQRLASLGYLPANGADSNFGPATYHAVVAFQKWEGLDRDGVVGPQTTKALRRATRPTPITAGSGRRIEVLLDRQLALLIQDGYVARTISVSTGGPGHSTPAGSFRVYRKEERSWSNPYKVWLPFASYFNQGIAFHAYPSVPPYAASHGCTRVPPPFAAELYAFARMGTPVRVLATS
jgi:peptidoglycan hydrolase-like protein with peptidoglycan-binding domain